MQSLGSFPSQDGRRPLDLASVPEICGTLRIHPEVGAAFLRSILAVFPDAVGGYQYLGPPRYEVFVNNPIHTFYLGNTNGAAYACGLGFPAVGGQYPVLWSLVVAETVITGVGEDCPSPYEVVPFVTFESGLRDRLNLSLEMRQQAVPQPVASTIREQAPRRRWRLGRGK